MTKPVPRDAVYRCRVFDADTIELCVRWYGVTLAHATIPRWVLRYVPEYQKRWNGFACPVGTSWQVDETYAWSRGRWHYPYRAYGTPAADQEYRSWTWRPDQFRTRSAHCLDILGEVSSHESNAMALHEQAGQARGTPAFIRHHGWPARRSSSQRN